MRSTSRFIPPLDSIPRVVSLASLVVVTAFGLTGREASAEGTESQAASQLLWVDDYQKALDSAKKQDGLVLLDFYTDWCGWCKRLDRDVFAADSFKKAASNVYGVKVNAEKNRKLANEFGVTSYPRLFFVDGHGRTLERIRGYLNLAQFTAKVQSVKNGDTEYHKLEAAAGDPSNLNASQSFAKFLSDTGRLEESIPYWQQVHDLGLQRMFENPGVQGNDYFHRQALLNLGSAFRTVGLHDVSRQHLEDVVLTYSESREAPDALFQLIQLDLEQGKRPDAARRLNDLASKYPRSAANQSAHALRRQFKPADGGTK